MSRKTILSVLEEVHELLSRRGRWCRYHHAEDRSGDPVDPLEPEAYRFCILGAVNRCCGEDENLRRTVKSFLGKISYAERNCPPSTFNDNAKTKGEVIGFIELAMLTRRIQLASRRKAG